jgi:DNA-binding NarL/FixJ family response regulator
MSITVFLADDHAIVRDGLRLILSEEPDIAVVGGTDNGRDAVRAIKDLRPDIAVIDIAMPGLNGIDAAQRICHTCPKTQVIILSMHCTRGHVSRALQAGARGYVLKESAGSEVVKAVRRVHDGHSYMSQKVSDLMVDAFARGLKLSDAESPLQRLSPRERQVLQLVVEGNSSAEIGGMLSLSPKTVETYRSRLMDKLGVDDFLGLIKLALRHDLISLD